MLDLASPLARMGGWIQVTSPVYLFDFGLPHRVSEEGLPLLARGQVSALLAGPGTGPEPSWQPHPPGRRGERSAHFPQPGTDSLLETENSVGWDPETGHRCDPWAEARSQGDRGRAGEGGLPGPHPRLILCFFPKLTGTYLSCVGRVQRGGREEKIKEGEKQQGASVLLRWWSPWSPDQLQMQTQTEGGRDGAQDTIRDKPSLSPFPTSVTPRAHPCPTDPEHGPRTAASAGWEGSLGQASCDQDVWPCPPHSAAGTAGPLSSALQGTHVRRSACVAPPWAP